MQAEKNQFKQSLKNGDMLFGCWLNLASSLGAEIVGRAGFDWVLIDAEHGPIGLSDITTQLQTLEGLDASAIVRVPIGETWIIKQVLDAGAQSLLIPLVENAQQAREHVHAIRYPPNGNRGVGAFVARAAQFGKLTEYLESADEQICLLIQLETKRGFEALEDMLLIDGVDGIFIGPSDLAADMGFLGNPKAPEVQSVIADALKRIAASGKVAGILSLDDEHTKRYIEQGARMVGVASDVLTLNHALQTKAAKWRSQK